MSEETDLNVLVILHAATGGNFYDRILARLSPAVRRRTALAKGLAALAATTGTPTAALACGDA